MIRRIVLLILFETIFGNILYASLYTEGLRYLQMGDYTQARYAFYVFYRENRSDPYAPAALFEYCKLQVEISNVTRDLEYLVENYPNFRKIDEVLITLGKVYYITGEYEQAIETFEALIYNHTQSQHRVEACYFLGKAYYNRHDYEEARDYFRLLIRMYPHHDMVPQSLCEIGEAYLAQNTLNSIEQALNQFKRVVDDYRYATCRPKALFMTGVCYFRLKQYQQAESYFSTLLQQFPNSLEAHDVRSLLNQNQHIFSVQASQPPLNPTTQTSDQPTNHALSDSGRFYIQVAVRSSNTINPDLQQRVQEHGYTVRSRAYPGRSGLYQNFIGFFQSHEECLRVSRILEENNIDNMIKTQASSQSTAETHSSNGNNPGVSNSVGSYYIQLGVFRSREYAEELQNQAESLGYPIRIRTLPINDAVFQVYIGFFETRNQAQQVEAQLKHNNIDCFVTKDE